MAAGRSTRYAGHPVHQRPGQADGRRGRGQGTRRPGGHQPGSAPGLQALDQEVPGHPGERRVRAPPETLGGVREQPVALGHGPHRAGVEPGALQQHPAGGGGHLGAVPAHEPGHADGPLVVGDEQILGGELALHPVQGHQDLPFPGPAHRGCRPSPCPRRRRGWDARTGAAARWRRPPPAAPWPCCPWPPGRSGPGGGWCPGPAPGPPWNRTGRRRPASRRMGTRGCPSSRGTCSRGPSRAPSLAARSRARPGGTGRRRGWR